jgi:hypothetical protein
LLAPRREVRAYASFKKLASEVQLGNPSLKTGISVCLHDDVPAFQLGANHLLEDAAAVVAIRQQELGKLGFRKTIL